MKDNPKEILSPEEAGAFVTQWAERNPVTAEQLAEHLSIDPKDIPGLMRQAQGRLSMSSWINTAQSSSASSHTYPWVLKSLILIIPLLLGAVAWRILDAKSNARLNRRQAMESNGSFTHEFSPMGTGQTMSSHFDSPRSAGDSSEESLASLMGTTVGIGIAKLTMASFDSSTVKPIPSLRTSDSHQRGSVANAARPQK